MQTRCLLFYIKICIGGLVGLPALVFGWQTLDTGLWLGSFKPHKLNRASGDKVIILKIDPKHYALKLLTAKELKIAAMGAEDWAGKFRLNAVINASMYQKDNTTSTGYTKDFNNYNNPSINPRFGAFLAFNPKNPNLPLVQIIDRYYQDWKKLLPQYGTIVQNYRMISLKQENAWRPQKESSSIACIGMDQWGNVLFIHYRTPLSVYEFNEILLKLPIDVRNVMYTEGGPEAFLYVKTDSFVGQWVGAHDIGILNSNASALPILPNVIGISKTNERLNRDVTDGSASKKR